MVHISIHVNFLTCSDWSIYKFYSNGNAYNKLHTIKCKYLNGVQKFKYAYIQRTTVLNIRRLTAKYRSQIRSKCSFKFKQIDSL